MSNEMSKQLNMVNLSRLCRKDEISFDVVAKNGNNVETTFNFVERTKFYDKLVRYCCRFWQQSNVASTKSNVASTLLLVWTGLKPPVNMPDMG